MSSINGKETIIHKIKNMITFRNPNNFDDYFATVLPTKSNYLKNNLFLFIF